MTDMPWTDDACSLVDAFRAGERSPREEVEATLAAIEATNLNCFSHVDPERALAAADAADLSLPFGGVPLGIKELESVVGWPETHASVVFADRVATRNSAVIDKILGEGGAVPVGLTTASEFGGLNVSVTKLNGVCHNPWQHGRTVGGSSGGSASAVVGGLVPIATAGDGGGSIRIPAGYTGLVGMKGTYGRITRGPSAHFRPGTVVLGCLARSVRDVARYFDVCSGPDPRDPSTLPVHTSFEAALGTHELAGRRVAIVPGLGGVTLEPGVEERIRATASELIAATGMVEVDLRIDLPNLAAQWVMGNLSTLLDELGDHWPSRAGDLTDELALGVRLAQTFYNLNTAARAESQRVEAYNAMADAFEQVDFVISATNPGPAFPATSTMSHDDQGFIGWAKENEAAKLAFRGLMTGMRVVNGAFPKLPNVLIDMAVAQFPDLVGMGALTIVSNIYGNPAVSIPAGLVDGLPVGMQVLSRHHTDSLLFDVALAAEREVGWPRLAPSVGDTVPA